VQRIHVYTTVGLIFGFTGIALLPSIIPPLAIIYATLGYLSSIKEVSTYTSRYQFFSVFFCSLLAGVFIDYPFHNFPFYTASMFFCALGSIGRVIFFQYFNLTSYKWFEPTTLFLALFFYLAGNIFYPASWQGWVLPGILIFFQGILTWGVYKDGKQLGSHAKGGYKVQIDSKAPDFALPDQNGSTVSLNDFNGKRNLLLIFVRGDWCPACHMMLRTYEKNNKKFQEKNIFCMAIGPDPIGVNREMVLKLGLDFKVLSDEKQRTAMNYGVQLDKYDNDFADKYDEGIPLPASFLVDKNGIVKYVSRPDKVGEFLNPSKIFPVIDEMKH